MALSPAARSRVTLVNRFRTEAGLELPDMNNNMDTTNDDRRDNEARTTKQGRYLIASKNVMSRRKIHFSHKQYCLQAVPVRGPTSKLHYLNIDRRQQKPDGKKWFYVDLVLKRC